MFTKIAMIVRETEIGSDEFLLLKVEDCVWSSPNWMRLKRGLCGFGIYKDLEVFLRSTLQIRDLNWRDLIEELETIKSDSDRDASDATLAYSWLSDYFEQDDHNSDLDELR